MVSGIRLIQHLETIPVGYPVKFARIDDNAADSGAMTTDVLGQ